MIGALLALSASLFLLMVLLQTVLNKRVWNGYLIGLAVSAFAWVIWYYQYR